MVVKEKTTIILDPSEFYKQYNAIISSDGIKPTNDLSDKVVYLTKKYKLADLKSIAQHYRVAYSGTKTVVAERICRYFHKLKYCLTIQRVFRGHLVRCWMANAYLRRRKQVVNETDGYTLEPLEDIPMARTICLGERINGHTHYYAFDVATIIPVIKQTLDNKRKPLNIYTRNEISKKALSKIILIYYLIRAMFPDTCAEIHEELKIGKSGDVFLQLRSRRRRNEPAAETRPIENAITVRHAKTLNVRIYDIFNELHYLGNYVVSSWFNNLGIYDCVAFYELLYELWTFRLNITQELRNRISPNRDPFSNTHPMNRWANCTSPVDVLRICVETMEYMVFDGVDEDARKLGGMYVLSALTVFSTEARAELPWLYESVAI